MPDVIQALIIYIKTIQTLTKFFLLYYDCTHIKYKFPIKRKDMKKLVLWSLFVTTITYANQLWYKPSGVAHTVQRKDGFAIRANILAGTAKKSYDSTHKKVDLMNIYGGHHLLF